MVITTKFKTLSAREFVTYKFTSSWIDCSERAKLKFGSNSEKYFRYTPSFFMVFKDALAKVFTYVQISPLKFCNLTKKQYSREAPPDWFKQDGSELLSSRDIFTIQHLTIRTDISYMYNPYISSQCTYLNTYTDIWNMQNCKQRRVDHKGIYIFSLENFSWKLWQKFL